MADAVALADQLRVPPGTTAQEAGEKGEEQAVLGAQHQSGPAQPEVLRPRCGFAVPAPPGITPRLPDRGSGITRGNPNRGDSHTSVGLER